MSLYYKNAFLQRGVRSKLQFISFLMRQNLIKFLNVCRYSFIFSDSGPSGILGSDGKQDTA